MSTEQRSPEAVLARGLHNYLCELGVRGAPRRAELPPPAPAHCDPDTRDQMFAGLLVNDLRAEGYEIRPIPPWDSRPEPAQVLVEPTRYEVSDTVSKKTPRQRTDVDGAPQRRQRQRT